MCFVWRHSSAMYTFCCVKWSTKIKDKNHSPTVMASINQCSTNDYIIRTMMTSKAFRNFQLCNDTTWHSRPEVSSTLAPRPSPHRTNLIWYSNITWTCKLYGLNTGPVNTRITFMRSHATTFFENNPPFKVFPLLYHQLPPRNIEVIYFNGMTLQL